MPITPTYPGVHVEEIPGGVRTITGVATSITAFLGRTLWGPDNEPTTVNGFGDFEREFGGLVRDLPMTYAVRDFFANGGGQAIIVRALGTKDSTKLAAPAKTTLDNGATVQASSKGEWGNYLFVQTETGKTPDDYAKQFDPTLSGADFFNLSVFQFLTQQNADSFSAGPAKSGVAPYRTEKFLNVSASPKAGPRALESVLDDESSLIEVPPTAAGSSSSSASSSSSSSVASSPSSSSSASSSSGGSSGSSGSGGSGSTAPPWKQLGGGLAGGPLQPNDLTGVNPPTADDKIGLNALDKANLFNLLCIPNDARDQDTDPSIYSAAMDYCQLRRAMLIVDPPVAWGANRDKAANTAAKSLSDLNLTGPSARNAALYFPRINMPDPLKQNQINTFAPCGAVAGVMARTDASRGVWKAPAGIDATLSGVPALQVEINDNENGQLNPLGINCLRFFPIYGRVVWGARTLRGADQVADEYKYIPVRRLALYIEESLFRGTKWVVFEPNDEPLWAQVRLNVGAFMNNLFRQGAFQGTSPRDAYFVKCDGETTAQNDIALGIVKIVVGFAPLKPAEFVFIKLQQIAGQVQV